MDRALSVLRQEEASEKIFSQQEMERWLGLDELTGIYNRQMFCKAVEELFQQYPEDEFVILRLDVERFRINQ